MFAQLLAHIRRRNLVPEMSETERVALEAGSVWIDGELFSGRPDLEGLLVETYPRLSRREQDFLDGPVSEVCAMVDQRWVERHKDLPPEVWAYLRQHRFFGLALPRKYGGHELSSLAVSSVFGMLGSHSFALQSVVLIPNSVGPGELLLEVGTKEQKAHYLPRLARGEEIPCFALTEPTAGSDAAAMTSRGVVFEGNDGELFIRLDWNKRYITLAPIATLLGLAFRLEDPDNLLALGPSPGITCALVPTDLPGVEIGRRHDPMGLPFANGPTRGSGVVIPVRQIIGGPRMAGRGWQMLMEALSGGRAISLPAGAAMGAKRAARVVGAYSIVRQQFGLSVGHFEGIEEPLARIGGLSYLMEAARVFTCGAIDAGERPSVISALMKYNLTELARQLANDAMDVLAGAAICRGPRNLIADGYLAAPIGITVEGANILTRTLIVFGQGAIRCHPHIRHLMDAIRDNDATAFRASLWAQAQHVWGNFGRGLLLGLSRGRWADVPVRRDPTAVYYRRLAWASARFAFYSDLVMVAFGPALKRRGKITGRLADILSWMYLAAATLRRYEAEGRRSEDLPLVHWSLQTSMHRIQQAFEGLLANVDVPWLGAWLRGPIARWHRFNPIGHPPSDRLGGQVAEVLRRPGEQRDRLTSGLFAGHPEGDALRDLERAFELTVETAPLTTRLRQAVRRGTLPSLPLDHLLARAVAEGVLSAEEATRLADADAARLVAIQVDDMSLEELRGEDATNRASDGLSTEEPNPTKAPMAVAS